MFAKFFSIFLLVLSLRGFTQNVYNTTVEDNVNAIVANLKPGDTLKLGAGIFPGPIQFRNIKGELDNPIVVIGPDDISNSAVIDGQRPSPNVATSYNWLEIDNSSWIEFINLHFQNAWSDPLPVNNSSYISFKNCFFQGGRRLINVRGADSHHVLVENCFWDQGASYAWNVRSWTDGDAWESMHHGMLAFLNGSLFTSQGTSGGHVLRGNTIQNAFNAFRWRGDEGFDANIEIYENTIRRIRDNDFEPEDYAKNLFIHHNWTHNIHKTLSIDHVRGGNIYYFGNVITNDDNDWAEDICTGYYKIYGTGDDNLTEPVYIFNNSYYGSGRLHGSINERRIKHVRHFNNAFYLTKRKWELDQWNESLIYDFDCSNKSFSDLLRNNGQEENGIVADPLFVSPESYDLRLQSGSPCIDAGGVVSIPNLSWQSTYEGEAPDIGAFDNGEPIVGPFFKTDTLALAEPLAEHSRITQLISNQDSTYLSFSYPLEESSIAGNLTLIDEKGNKSLLLNFALLDEGYTIGFVSAFEVRSAFISGPVKGINGLNATNWANHALFNKREHDNVVVYMLHPQLEPRVPPPPAGVYVNGSLSRTIVPKGTDLEVKATVDEGFRFDRWEGDLQGNDAVLALKLSESAWIIGHFVRVEEEEEEEVLSAESKQTSLYPNPCEGILYFDNIDETSSVRIVNMQGKVKSLIVENKRIDLRSFEDGLYILEIKNDQESEVLKVLLKKKE